MLSEENLGSLLNQEIKSTERPSSVIDVRAAMTAGRRARRRRRAGGAALAVTAVVCAVTAGSVVLAANRGDHEPAFIEPAPATSPSATPAPGTAPVNVDPMIKYLRPGWLPDGLPHRSYYSRTGNTDETGYAFLSAQTTSEPNGDGVTVFLYPKGVTPPPPQVTQGRNSGPVVTDGPRIQGVPSQWVRYEPPQGHLPEEDHGDLLQWEYAPGGWIRIDVRGLTDPRTVATRVAEKLTVSTTEAVVLPMPPPVLTNKVRVDYVSVTETVGVAGSATASVAYTSAAPDANRSAVNSDMLMVVVNPYRGEDRTGGKGYSPANTTVDGHPAATAATSKLCGLAVYNVNGVNVSADANGTQILAALGPDACRGVYRQVHLAPGAGTWSPGLR
jgi:hypothetical protein